VVLGGPLIERPAIGISDHTRHSWSVWAGDGHRASGVFAQTLLNFFYAASVLDPTREPMLGRVFRGLMSVNIHVV